MINISMSFMHSGGYVEVVYGVEYSLRAVVRTPCTRSKRSTLDTCTTTKFYMSSDSICKYLINDHW